MSMPGSINGQVKPADAKTTMICAQVKTAAEEKSKKLFILFKPINYKTQLVAGTVYFIKVQVGAIEYNHYKIFVGLPKNGISPPPQLTGVQEHKTLADPIVYF